MRSILAPTNSVINRINEDMLKELPGDEILFKSIDSDLNKIFLKLQLSLKQVRSF